MEVNWVKYLENSLPDTPGSIHERTIKREAQSLHAWLELELLLHMFPPFLSRKRDGVAMFYIIWILSHQNCKIYFFINSLCQEFQRSFP